MSKIMISELAETTTAPDESYIAIDNGSATNKITIANYNANANHTAKRYADAAEGYADNAIAARDSAISAKNECETLVNSASNFANAASTNASAAAGSASEASGYVGSAQASASNALASARAADNSAADAANQVLQSKSWAQGNTGVRAGENTNNAKYWSEVARGAAGGGVSTFNGRFGAVVPESGDYSSDQIAHVNSDSTYSNVETEINNLQTSRLKTYASDATQWDAAPTANSTKPVTSGGIKAQFDLIDTQITDINEDIADVNAEIADLHTEDSRLSTQISNLANPNWTQFGSTYTYTPSVLGQVYLGHSFGAVPSNATRVGITIVQEGDIESFVELHKGHSTAIYEFSQTAVLANWIDNNTVGISYARFVATNKLTVKAYYK